MRENMEELPHLLEWVRKLKADSLCFSDLVGGANADEGWSAGEDGWKFRFSEQNLRSCPELRQRVVTLTESKAKEYAIPITGSLRWDPVQIGKNAIRTRAALLPAFFHWPGWTSTPMEKPDFAVMRCDRSAMSWTHSLTNSGSGSIARNTREELSQDRVPPPCSGASCPYVHGRLTESETLPKGIGSETTTDLEPAANSVSTR